MHWEDPEMVADFVAEAEERLDDVDGLLLELESDPSAAQLRDSVVGCFHTIKGMAGYVELVDVQDLCHAVEAMLEGLGSGSATGGPAVNLAFDAVTELRAYLEILSRCCEADIPLPDPSPLAPLIVRAGVGLAQLQRRTG